MDPLMMQLRGRGHPRPAAAMAAAYVGKARESSDRAAAFCDNYRQLTSMGFAPPVVVGALVKHRNDLSAATDTCLNAAT